MGTNGSNQRSIQNVLINKPLQREFTIFLIVVMMTAGAIVGWMIHHTMMQMIEEAPRTLTHATFTQMVEDARVDLLLGCIFIIFVSVIFTGFMGVMFLHRVAGPVYRFGMVLRKIAGGQIPHEISLRSRDFFKETAIDINHVIKYLRDQKHVQENLKVQLDKIKEEDISEPSKEALRNIRKCLKDQ